MPRVCVDASLVLSWLLPEEYSGKAEALWKSWREQGIGLIAPPLLYAEVLSVLRQAVFFKRLLEEEGEAAYRSFFGISIQMTYIPRVYTRAWELAKELSRPRIYDMVYLALADIQGCPLWTADKRLVQAVQDKSQWARWVGDYRG